MRFLIAVLIYFCCFSTSLFAKEVEVKVVVQNSVKNLPNYSKKQKSCLKTELFTDQVDLLHPIGQNNSVAAVHFNLAYTIYMVQSNFDFNPSPLLFYNFIFQYLYPKHSFW